MKQFAIYGTVIDTDEQRGSFEDVTPAQFRSVISKLDKGEELQVAINSPGGSVYGGIAIANMIRQLSAKGHKVTAIVEGLAASIASVIMCACDKVVLGESSLVMIHNCWSVVQGDSNTLRKEAETMDIMNKAIVSFYKSKFDLSDEVLKQMMDEETWFSGREAYDFKFNCEVIPDAGEFSIAAKVKDLDLSKFKNKPKVLDMEKIEESKTDGAVEEIKPVEEVKDEAEQADETVVEESETIVEEQTEETTAEPVVEESEIRNEVEETVPKAEVEKRVSGMQSAMAKQMDAMKKDYEAKIEDFKVQIKAKDEELANMKAEATRLADSLEKYNRELAEMTSALEEKQNALDVLNAGVNTPKDATNWKALKGKEFFDWYRRTH